MPSRTGRARHNLNYWRFGDYLGIGAGAHATSCRSRTGCCARCATSTRPPLSRGESRRTRCRKHAMWDRRDLPFEFMLNALRLVEGFPVHRFIERAGSCAMTSIRTGSAGSGAS